VKEKRFYATVICSLKNANLADGEMQILQSCFVIGPSASKAHARKVTKLFKRDSIRLHIKMKQNKLNQHEITEWFNNISHVKLFSSEKNFKHVL